MNLTVFSDCHWHGPSPVEISPEFGTTVFYIGDNHEFKNITREKIAEYRDSYLTFLQRCKLTGTQILNGNHEVSTGFNNNNNKVIITGDHSTALVHFHRELWPERRVIKWHGMEPGKSKVIILLIKIKDVFRNRLGPVKLTKKHIRICRRIADQYHVKNVVFGHTHPKRTIKEVHDGITMVNVPRGKTIIRRLPTINKG